MTKHLIVALARGPVEAFEKEYVFDSSPVSIGTHPNNTLVLEGEGISKYHGLIFFTDQWVKYLAFPINLSDDYGLIRIPAGESIPVGALEVTLRLAESVSEQWTEDRDIFVQPLAALDRELIRILRDLTSAVRAIPMSHPEIVSQFAKRAVAILDTISAVLLNVTTEGLRSLKRTLPTVPLTASTGTFEILDYLLEISGEQSQLDHVRERIMDLLRHQILTGPTLVRA